MPRPVRLSDAAQLRNQPIAFFMPRVSRTPMKAKLGVSKPLRFTDTVIPIRKP